MSCDRLRRDDIALLHRMDSIRGDATILTASRERVRRSAFLDGRETFWSREEVVPLRPSRQHPHPARRFVFHVGFCGSTLLARLLDSLGDVLVLREPQCLTDIASQRGHIARGEAVAPLGTLVDHALGCLGSVGAPDEKVVIKPSNWVNPLLSQLFAFGRSGSRAVFLSTQRRAYLGACFRGGRPRLDFCLRLAAGVASVTPDGGEMLRLALHSDDDPLAVAARGVALLHWMQVQLFDDAIAANEALDALRVDFAELLEDPQVVVRRVQQALDLEPEGISPARLRDVMARHTKDPTRQFDTGQRGEEDAAVEAYHGSRFDAAEAWLDSLLGARC